MAEGKLPEGVSVRSKKHNYPVRSWKITGTASNPRSRWASIEIEDKQGSWTPLSPEKPRRRVIFRKLGKDSSARLELVGPPEVLAAMFSEMAAALWGLDGSDKGVDPNDPESTTIFDIPF